MRNAIRDFHYALRQINKNLGFSVTVIATLALTAGLSTAIFSVLDALLIRPLPYSHPERIAVLNTYSPQGYTQPASYPDYLDWRRDSTSFSALAGYNTVFGGANLESPAGPVALNATITTDNFFEVFGVKPLMGRTFNPGEDQPGRNAVAVLSFEAWRQSFGGRSGAVGSKVQIDGKPYTLVGVMPAGFRFPVNQTNAIYLPLNLPGRRRDARGNHWLPTVARLKPGLTMSEAEQRMNFVLASLARVHPEEKGQRVKLTDLTTFTLGDTPAALRLLVCAVGALLAIGCVNIAGLLLARGVRFEKEVALRSLLGAGRLRLASQMLAEIVIFSAAGAGLGTLLAYALLHWTRALLISALARGTDIEVDLRALAVALAIAVLTSVLAGLAPVLRLSRVSTGVLLRAGLRASTGRGQHRLRTAFVVSQVALAFVLVVTAGLLMHALAELRNADLGFNPDHLLTAEIDLSPGRYETRDVIADFYTPLLERVRATPGVQAAGLIQLVPIQSWGWNMTIKIIGQPPPPNQERLAELRLVTPGYYSAFGDTLVGGRMLDEKLDTPSSARAAVINEAFVRKFFRAGDNPIGQHWKDGDDTVTIVGVVRNIRQNILAPPMAEMDYPISQIPPKLRSIFVPGMHLVVRTAGKPEAVTGDLRRIFHEIDPTLPFRAPISMQDVIAGSLTFERLENWLFGTFAACAGLLAIVGLYGLVSHDVETAKRDTGVRMALGATPARIFGGVYRRVGIMLGAGFIAGLLLTSAADQIIGSAIPTGTDGQAAEVVGLAASFLFAAILAAYLPARRAAALDPIESLRSE